MNTVFYLVRHRESEKNVLEIHHSKGINDFPLTEKGKLQSVALREDFRGKTIDIIYTSPYKRCIQTIEDLAKTRNIEYSVDERITELNVGELDRTPWRLSWDDSRRLTDIPIGKTGESLLQCQQRVWRFLDDIKKQHQGESILICSHGESLLFAKQYFIGFNYDNPDDRDSQYPAKDGFDEFIIDKSGELIEHTSHGAPKI